MTSRRWASWKYDPNIPLLFPVFRNIYFRSVRTIYALLFCKPALIWYGGVFLKASGCLSKVYSGAGSRTLNSDLNASQTGGLYDSLSLTQSPSSSTSFNYFGVINQIFRIRPVFSSILPPNQYKNKFPGKYHFGRGRKNPLQSFRIKSAWRWHFFAFCESINLYLIQIFLCFRSGRLFY